MQKLELEEQKLDMEKQDITQKAWLARYTNKHARTPKGLVSSSTGSHLSSIVAVTQKRQQPVVSVNLQQLVASRSVTVKGSGRTRIEVGGTAAAEA
ncbi:unnamed protein product [Zymoseptoria tritici ST99CH_3D1]|nr:unnamed protein product [Zymoseptoria tritici ST99CH_3D1]